MNNLTQVGYDKEGNALYIGTDKEWREANEEETLPEDGESSEDQNYPEDK